ncbi:MAG: hypothetical protein R3A11_08105 [Bdellovibrionota bacterium]
MKKIQSHQNLEGFFYQQIKNVVEKNSMNLDEALGFYLVNLLSTTHQKIAQSDPSVMDTPLALLFGKAQSSEDLLEKRALWKNLGDHSLYISGFFSDHLTKSAVDIDYYMHMGGTAYQNVSFLSRESRDQRALSDMFESLAKRFREMVDLLSQISESVGITSNEDILRIYERWIHTKSQHLLKKLQNEGIDPLNAKKKNLH